MPDPILRDDVQARLEALAYHFWSLHPSTLDPLPVASDWANRGGRRAKYYADQMAAFFSDITTENARLKAEIARLGGTPPVSPSTASEDGEPGYDFRALFALRAGADPEAFIVEQSQDCRLRDILVDGYRTSDNGDTLAWAKDRPTGLYAVRLNPTINGDDFKLNVTEVTALCQIADPLDTSAPDRLKVLENTIAALENASPPPSTRVRMLGDANSPGGETGTIARVAYRISLDGPGGPDHPMLSEIVETPREGFTLIDR